MYRGSNKADCKPNLKNAGTQVVAHLIITTKRVSQVAPAA
jgi:hypothetical protein